MLVGWFSPPPSFVTDTAPLLGVSVPAGHHQVILDPGVLTCVLENPTPDGYRFKWRMGRPGLPFNHLDPDDIFDDNPQVRTGLLRHPSDINERFTLDRTVEIRFDISARSYQAFRLTKPFPRLSLALIEQLTPALRGRVIAEQVRPTPESYWNRVRTRVVGSSSSATESQLIRLLRRWRHAEMRDKVNLRALIAAEVTPPRMSSAYADVYATRLRGMLLGTRPHPTGSPSLEGDKTIFGHLQDLAGEESDYCEAHSYKDSTTLKALASAGISPAGSFRYTLSFHSIGKAKGKGHGKLIVGLGFHAVLAHLKKETLVAGSSPEQWITRFDTEKSGEGYVCVFGELGAGLGFSTGIGVSKDPSAPKSPKPSLKEREGDALPGKVTFTSSMDLTRADFILARFTTAAVKGPSASFGVIDPGALAGSTFVEIYLPEKHHVLSGSVQSTIDLAKIKLPKLELDVDDPAGPYKKYIDKIRNPELEGSLFTISMGYGVLLADNVRIVEPYLSAQRIAHAGSQAFGHRETRALFAVDSHKLDEFAAPGEPSVRLELEKFLAIEQAFFVECEGNELSLVGHASPEHHASYNQVLSEARAFTLSAAIIDAFGHRLRIRTTDMRTEGAGESLALRSGLRNPPDDPPGRKRFLAAYPDEVKRWPEFRRVDVTVNGAVLLRARTES
jgi:outer membrane protein OmpA-like peptidoglycan-associated protein